MPFTTEAPLPQDVVGTPAGYCALYCAIEAAVSAESAPIASFGLPLPPSRPRMVPSALPRPETTACVKPPFTKLATRKSARSAPLCGEPTVLTDVTQEHAAFTDEIFGPVAPVTTFRTDEEALALANSSEYGLVGAVYSTSMSRGLSIAQRIKAGMVHVNDGTLNDEATIPFGGTGMSGNGARYGGEANLDNFTEWQWVTVRDEPPRFPF